MVKPVQYQLNGGALYYAIIVILLLSMISSGFILINRLWFHENALLLKNTELNDNLDSIDQYLRIQPDFILPGQTKELDLFGDSSLVKIEAERWGLLRLFKSSAQWNRITIVRNSLYAGLNYKRYALFVADNNKFLSLVGKCVIKGDCSLPALGIRAGEMDGATFIGEKMIDGTIEKSGNVLPKLSPELLNSWIQYWDKMYQPSDSIIGIGELYRNPACNNSFSSSTLVVDCENDFSLQDVTLSGKIILVSDGKITITPSAHLQDVLVFAKSIVINDNVNGAVQLFARDEIIIGENCRLRFPSFLVCLGDHINGKITIGKNSAVNGGILLDSVNDLPLRNKLEMSQNNKLTGTVYVNGEVGFAGQIDGSLYCNRFYIDTPRAYYENFLKDAVINSQSTPAKFGSFTVDDSPDNLILAKLCL